MTIREAGHLRVEVHEEDPDQLLEGIREGLLRDPREISPRFFYDDQGSQLFERISELDAYYQTRTEAEILRRVAGDIVAVTGAEELIELGSGAATKTRLILDAMNRAGTLHKFVPFDVSEGIVRRVAGEILDEYPGIRIHAVVGNFIEHLEGIPPGDHQLCIFLGGTIGNFRTGDALQFLEEVAGQLSDGGYFLIGTDLIKDRGRLELAYNDPQGVTADFNRNALRVLNRLLDGNFDPETFEHRALFNEEKHRVEMWLRSLEDQKIDLPRIDLSFRVEKGEEILTEISTKFDREKVEALLAGAGFRLQRFYTDPKSMFALSLAQKA